MKKQEIVVALDGMEVNEALHVARLLSGRVWGFKINDLLLEAGTSIIPRLRQFGYVFCDPKLHDIPQAVADSVKKLARAGANIISVHATGDIKMLVVAVKNRQNSKVVGISNLTSNEKSSPKKLLQAAFNILVSRSDGIVCSVSDLKILQNHHDYRFLATVTPGIRPLWWNPVEMGEDKKDDQKRIATPGEAVKAGTDFLVIGRPITQSQNPLEAVEKIQYEITNIQTE